MNIASRASELHHPGAQDVVDVEDADGFSPVENEQNRITLASPKGQVTFKQIAGALARRIVFYPRMGDELRRGQRIGLIKFGSRVDLFLPDDAEVLVARGDKLKAGQSAIARWGPAS